MYLKNKKKQPWVRLDVRDLGALGISMACRRAAQAVLDRYNERDHIDPENCRTHKLVHKCFYTLPPLFLGVLSRSAS